jgi:putative ferrous iron transport protein C
VILQGLQDYLREHNTASLTQMEASLGVSADALRGMLNLLERKGRVQRLPRPERCHGCSLCDGHALEFYCWRDSPAP